MKWIKRIVVVLFLIVVFLWGILFASENTTQVPLNLLLVEVPAASISVWLVASFALGGLVGILISLVLVTRLKIAHLSVRKKLSRSEEELSRLRTVASRDSQ